jgi:hypothetical protein
MAGPLDPPEREGNLWWFYETRNVTTLPAASHGGLGPNSASPTVARRMLSVQPTCMPRVGPCANRCRAGRPLGQGRASRRAASERMGHWPGTIGPVGNDRVGRVESGSCTVWKETPATYSSRMTPGLVACSQKPRPERRASAGTSSELAVTSGIAECARTTDQLRTTTSALGKHQRSTVDAGEKAFTLSHCHAPIWGSRARQFLSRRPKPIHSIRPRTCVQPTFLPPSITPANCAERESDRL